MISDGSISLTQERCVQTRCPAASLRCKIPLCRPVRPEVNIIDLIRTNGGIRGAAQFEKTSACSTYPPEETTVSVKLYFDVHVRRAITAGLRLAYAPRRILTK